MDITDQTLLLAFGLGLLGFVEPCKQHFEKPSEKKVRQQAEAIRRARKAARKRLEREGVM